MSRFVTKSVFLNNTEMPVSLICEHCTRFDESQYTLTKNQAYDIFVAEDYLYRMFTLSECESIGAQLHFSEDASVYRADVLYECAEDIALYENFVVN